MLTHSYAIFIKRYCYGLLMVYGAVDLDALILLDAGGGKPSNKRKSPSAPMVFAGYLAVLARAGGYR